MYLLTGAGGFLGTAIAKLLVQRGETVRGFSRSQYPHLRDLGVEQLRGDLADIEAVRRAAQGCEAIIHVGAKAGIGGNPRDYEQANVIGTRNVLAACLQHGISKLVFTSSPSVAYGTESIEGGDESLPYPHRYLADYPRTKAIAEKEVLDANGSTLATVALRPHLIYGPGDNHLFPRLVERARAGQLRQIGDGRNRADVIFIEDAADAHILALDRLHPGATIAGRAFFLSQGEPVLIWDFINRMLATAGLKPVQGSLPASVAYAIGWALESGYRLLNRTDEPRMTRFLAKQLSTSHWFDISAAKSDLGFEPKVQADEGLRRLAAWVQTGGLTKQSSV